MNYEEILNQLLSNIDDSLDKREGSLIYNALAPICMEFLNLKIQLDDVLDLFLLDTSIDDYLTRLADQYGVERLEATKSVRKIIFTSTNESEVQVKVGDRFMLDDVVFSFTEKTSLNEGLVECEKTGEIGNRGSGQAVSLQIIPNLSKAEITDVKIYGEDEEDDDSLRDRLKISLAKNPSSGNLEYYQKEMSEINGVGRCKYLPFHNGGNTLLITITDSFNSVASEELISSVQKRIDPLEAHGLGMGKAPLGVKVSINTATRKEINIVAHVKLNDGYQEASGIEEEIRAYFSSISFLKDSVSYLKTGSVIMDSESVQDVVSLTLNGLEENIPLDEYEVPVLADLQVEVV